MIKLYWRSKKRLIPFKDEQIQQIIEKYLRSNRAPGRSEILAEKLDPRPRQPQELLIQSTARKIIVAYHGLRRIVFQFVTLASGEVCFCKGSVIEGPGDCIFSCRATVSRVGDFFQEGDSRFDAASRPPLDQYFESADFNYINFSQGRLHAVFSRGRFCILKPGSYRVCVGPLKVEPIFIFELIPASFAVADWDFELVMDRVVKQMKHAQLQYDRHLDIIYIPKGFHGKLSGPKNIPLNLDQLEPGLYALKHQSGPWKFNLIEDR